MRREKRWRSSTSWFVGTRIGTSLTLPGHLTISLLYSQTSVVITKLRPNIVPCLMMKDAYSVTATRRRCELNERLNSIAERNDSTIIRPSRTRTSSAAVPDAGLPPDLRHAGPQLVTERAALRLVIEHGYGHKDDHARSDDFQSCPGTTVQQQSAATAPHGNDQLRPTRAFELRKRPPSTAMPLNGMEKITGKVI